MAPLLVLPEFFWPWGRIAVVAGAFLTCLLGLWLLSDVAPLAVMAATLVVAAFIGWTRAASQETALSHLAGFAFGLGLMATLRLWSNTVARTAFALTAIVALGLLLVTIGFFSASIPAPTKYLNAQYLPQIPLHLPNLETGGLINPNALGVTALIVLPMAVALACWKPDLTWRDWTRVLGVFGTASCTVVLVVTQSRSAWGAAWLTVITILLATRRLTAWRVVGLAVVVVVPVGVVLWVRAHLDPTVATASSRISARAELWREGYDQLTSSPWFGIGMNAFRHVSRVDPNIPHVHNVFLQTALDCGIVGLAGYVGILAWIGRAALHVRRTSSPFGPVAAGAVLSIVAAHFFGLADAIALGAKVGIIQWFAAGLVLATDEIPRVSK